MSRSAERGLGRGLDALIPRTGGGLRQIRVDAVVPNPQQPRTRFDPDELNELAQSIREHGLLQPVLVSQQADGRYQLITGERRWRAAQLAGLDSLPALVKEATPQAALEMALVENIQRRDLNPLEEAHAYRQLLDEHGLTQEQLAQRLGKSRVSITNVLRLLQAPEPVRQAVAAGAITEGHARAILLAVGEPRRVRLLERVVDGQLSVRETEALARELNEEDTLAAEVSPPVRQDPDVERLEDAFRQALGTRVRLVKGRHGGRLIIHFYSDEELQGIYEAIVRE